jgi:hypothetical protein
VAWAFMLSLLFGALVSFVQEWLMPPNIVEWGILRRRVRRHHPRTRHDRALRPDQHTEG